MIKDKLTPQNGWTTNSMKIKVPENSLFFTLSTIAAKQFGRNKIPDIFKLLSVNKSIFLPWLHFASKLMPYGKLAARERELIILRVAWLCKCRYEWGQHIEIGINKAKLSDEDIINITKGTTAFKLKKEQLLIKACDEFKTENSISAQTWQILSTYYNDALLLEISFLIGHYIMLAGILNSTGLPLEQNMEDFLQAFHKRISI